MHIKEELKWRTVHLYSGCIFLSMNGKGIFNNHDINFKIITVESQLPIVQRKATHGSRINLSPFILLIKVRFCKIKSIQVFHGHRIVLNFLDRVEISSLIKEDNNDYQEDQGRHCQRTFSCVLSLPLVENSIAVFVHTQDSNCLFKLLPFADF